MSALLAITSSPRGDYSVSNALTHAFVDAYTAAHAGATVVTRDLQKSNLPWINLPWIMGAYTPAETHAPEMKEALAVSLQYIHELQAADHIVIGTAMYNFSLPAVLKAWIDHICMVNVTFTPQYEGLLKNKKVTIIIASGGTYTPGSPTESYNAESAYLKQVLGFIGLTDVNIILAGGTAAVSMGKISQDDLLAQFTPQVEAAAKA